MTVVFSHGKESGPWGSKIKRLAAVAQEYGHSVDSIDYTETMNPDKRAEMLLSSLNLQTGPVVLVGSSMGGYVSLVAAGQVKTEGLFLLAPALYIPGYQRQAFTFDLPPAEIVHGWSDEVIPPEHSIRFAQETDCTLHLISGDHRLNSSIETVERLFRQFLDRLTGK